MCKTSRTGSCGLLNEPRLFIRINDEIRYGCGLYSRKKDRGLPSSRASVGLINIDAFAKIEARETSPNRWTSGCHREATRGNGYQF